MRLDACCHVVRQKLAPEAMGDMQGTYQYWGARLFSTIPVTAASNYAFQMQVDNAARLWVNNILVIDATCMSSAQHKLHYNSTLSVDLSHPRKSTSCLWQS